MHHLPAAGLTLLVLVLSGVAYAWIAGPAAVTDDDTLKVSGQRVWLFGIDAPESKQLCVASG